MTVPSTRHGFDMLVVDDESDNLRSLEARLRTEFRKVGFEPQIKTLDDPYKACRLIEDRAAEPFDVIITDLMFPVGTDRSGPKDALGLNVIRDGRSASEDTVIVAITGHLPQYPHVRQLAQDARVDLFHQRSELLELAGRGGLGQLAQDVHDLLSDRGLVTSGPVLDHDEDPGILSVVADVAKVTLRRLLADIFTVDGTHPTRATITHVAPGRSGAHVIRASAVWPPGTPSRAYLVKLDRNREPLDREVRNWRNILGMFGRLIVPSTGEVYARGHGPNKWYAVASYFAEETDTLRRWLLRGENAVHVPGLLEHLFFGEGLAKSRVADRPETTTPVTPTGPLPAREPMPARRRALVRLALEELQPALTHPRLANLSDADGVYASIGRFTRSDVLPDGRPIGPIGMSGKTAYGFGDLHSGNVLVTRDSSPRPYLIDPADVGSLHWATDLARFSTDLILRCLDAGTASMTWERFTSWRTVADRYGEFDAGPLDLDDNEAVMAALRWLVAHHAQIIPAPAPPWEWHVVFAEQLVRGSYDMSLPPAKRALALVAAYDQLVHAAVKAPPPRSDTV